MIKKDFNVYNGNFYSLLETNNYGEIVFGCPPGIVKEFIKLKRPLPSKYIIPSQTFYDGKNNFDFEFIVYSFLFTRAPGSTVSAYCLPAQEKRFRDILNETLFGPRFGQLLEAQSNKFFHGKDQKKLCAFLRKNISNNNGLSILFDNLLTEHTSESQVIKRLKQFIDDKILSRHKWILKSDIKNLSEKLTKVYFQCAQLQKEFKLFSLAKERDHNKFISKIIKFHHIEKSGFFLISGKNDKRNKLKLQECEPGVFRVFEKKIARCLIDLNSNFPVRMKQKINTFQIPSLGITFVGVGSGFSHDKQNSSVIVWSEGKGILIDVVNDSNLILANYGINKNNINHIFLTHVHSDHDAGVLENILESRKTYLITSRIIYESFLRKTQALTSLSKKSIEEFVDFIEVEPNKTVKIPGFKKTFFEFDYSLHSIPSGRCKITYIEGKNKKSISHSGDTKYDVQKINAWYEKGAFTSKRKNSITGFIWDSDLIVHDVGGGNLHTNYESLLPLNKKIKDKIILVHQNDKPYPKSQLRYAKDGETIALIQ